MALFDTLKTVLTPYAEKINSTYIDLVSNRHFRYKDHTERLIELDPTTDFEPGMYSASNGTKTQNLSYIRSKYYYPAYPLSFLHCENIPTGTTISIFFYDKDYTYIPTVGRYLQNEDAYNTKYSLLMSPKNAAFFTLSIDTVSISETLKIQFVTGSGQVVNIDINYSDIYDGYVVLKNMTLTSSGGISASSETDVVLIPKPNANKIFTSWMGSTISSTTSLRCVALFENYPIDASNKALLDPSPATANNAAGSSKVNFAYYYTIPDAAVAIMLTFPKNTQLNVDGDCVSYANMLRLDERPLSMKKILCIGSTSYWIDGMSLVKSNDIGRVVGWQKELRYCGAIVDTLGFHNMPLQKNSLTGSIFDGIVTSEADLTEYDIIIINTGNGADLSSTYGDGLPVGTPPNDYDYNIDPQTLCGALSGLIQYIRSSNDGCKIYIETDGKSKSQNRTWAVETRRRSAILQTAAFWSIPVIDTFTLDNVSNVSSDQFDYFHFDENNYNYKGRIRQGLNITKCLLNNSFAFWISNDLLSESVVEEGSNMGD